MADPSEIDANDLIAAHRRLTLDLQGLTGGLAQLRHIQSKIGDCIHLFGVKFGQSPTENCNVLVPLTQSLFCDGKLSPTRSWIVDVGAGFFIEMDSSSAEKWYTVKSSDLGVKIAHLDQLIERRTGELDLIQATLRQMVLRAPAN